MKQTAILLLLFTFFLVACKVNEEPEYVKLEQVKVQNLTKSSATFTTNAVYYNPNHIGGKVKRMDIQVFNKDKKVADVNSIEFEINGRENFKVPLVVNIPLKELYTDKKNLIESIGGILEKKKIELHYKGEIVFDFYAFEYSYPIDDVYEVELKK